MWKKQYKKSFSLSTTWDFDPNWKSNNPLDHDQNNKITIDRDKFEDFGFGFVVLSIFIPFIIYYAFKILNISENVVQAGPIGDFISGTTVPLLTFSSILLLLSTIKTQKKELELQRNELIESRKVVKEQAKH